MINIHELSKGFERENLFENVNLIFHSKDKIAFIGKNGSGKTTFFNCLSGKENFQGRIMVSDMKISLMEQDQNFANLDKTFGSYLEDKKKQLEKMKIKLEKEIGNPDIFENEAQFDSLMDKYNLLLTDSSFDIEQENIQKLLDILGIDKEALNQKIKNLSGGQKTKLRLAECLSKKADLYLLDEPTNNLDLGTRKWLEDYINKNIESLIVISHDRYFLNQVSEKVWDLENKRIKEWKYKFEKYAERKEDYLKNLERNYTNVKKEKKRLLESAKQKRQWSTSKKMVIVAKRLEADAKKLDDVENPFDFIRNIKIYFNNEGLHNCNIFRMEDVEKKFDDKLLFKKVNSEIDFGEKVCILGENGMGKSTFLKMLIGKMNPSEGSVSQRKNIKIGYFDQELEDVNKEKTIIDFMMDKTGKNENQLISMLKKYGFHQDVFNKKIKYLSGGERGRLNILRISIEKNNVLILDEPTNNLDIHLVDSLEKALQKFQGTIVFVSHDRYFVDKIATRIMEIKDKKISSYPGNYSDYLEQTGQD